MIADLRGPHVTAASVCAAVGTGDVILYFGHGTETTVGQPVVLDTVSVANASGRSMVSIACLSGEVFGPSSVARGHLAEFLGFSEPLFVYIADPGLFGYEISLRLSSYLTGQSSLGVAASDLKADLQAIETLFHTGAHSHLPDALLVWMGARMNWRGLDVH